MSLILNSVCTTDPGLIRMNNEDSAHAGLRLLVIADGIGGAPAGEKASHLVVRALATLEAAQPPDPSAALIEAITVANRHIMETAHSDPANEGMGTTATALLLADDQATLLHIGDSRAYLLRGEVLTQLTRDDTLVQSLVDRGALTPEEARHHPQRSIITAAVQGRELTPSVTVLPVLAADRFLLCSDGLSDIVTDLTITQTLLSYRELAECVERLVKLALQAGAPDNVTVILADAVEA